MCRNIKTLYNFEPPTSEDEIRAAALQYVRKVSGFNKPSKLIPTINTPFAHWVRSRPVQALMPMQSDYYGIR